MKSLLIRRARRSDIEKLVEFRMLLQQHCEEANPPIWHMTAEGKALLRRKVEDELLDSNRLVLVAETNEETIGLIQGEVAHRTDYLPKTIGSISTAYVVPEFRKKEWGSLLVKQLCVSSGPKASKTCH